MFWFFYIFLWVGSYYVYDVGNSRKTMENMDQNYCDDCDVGDIGCSWFSKESWTSFWFRGQRRLGARCCGRLERVPWIKIIVDRIGRIYVALYFSPTAITLGSSAIVKVSGRNRFRTLYGSLGQIRLGLPQGSVEGSPGFQQGFTKVLQGGGFGFLGQIRLGLAKGSALSCLTHKPPFRRKRPIMSLLCMGLFCMVDHCFSCIHREKILVWEVKPTRMVVNFGSAYSACMLLKSFCVISGLAVKRFFPFFPSIYKELKGYKKLLYIFVLCF